MCCLDYEVDKYLIDLNCFCRSVLVPYCTLRSWQKMTGNPAGD